MITYLVCVSNNIRGCVAFLTTIRSDENLLLRKWDYEAMFAFTDRDEALRKLDEINAQYPDPDRSDW